MPTAGTDGGGAVATLGSVRAAGGGSLEPHAEQTNSAADTSPARVLEPLVKPGLRNCFMVRLALQTVEGLDRPRHVFPAALICSRYSMPASKARKSCQHSRRRLAQEQ